MVGHYLAPVPRQGLPHRLRILTSIIYMTKEFVCLIANQVAVNDFFCSPILMMEMNVSITKTFEEGQEAAALSKSKTDCPYQTDSQEGKDWHEGFDDRNNTNDM